MNLELAVLEVQCEVPPSGPLFCDVQLGPTAMTISLPSADLHSLPFAVDLLDEAVALTLRDREVIGVARISLRDLVHATEPRWHQVKSQARGKLISKGAAAAIKVQAKVSKRKTMHRPYSSLSSPTALKELRIPNRSPAFDNPNPSPPRPLSTSGLSSPEPIPLELEQAVNTVNEKVQTFHKIDGEMGKIQQQLAGLINSLESFDNESDAGTFPLLSKIADFPSSEVSLNKGEISPIEDRLGQDIRKTLGYLRSRAGSRASPSLQFTDIDELRQELKTMTELQKTEEKEVAQLRTKLAETLEAATASSTREKALRESLKSDKDSMARLLAKQAKELKSMEASLRSANHELRLLKLERTSETTEKSLKQQPPKLMISPPVADFTQLFEAQMEQHKALAEKYEALLQDCKKHRLTMSEMQEKLDAADRELQQLRHDKDQFAKEVTGLTQTCQYLEAENQKLREVGLAAAARVSELTELTRDVDILSNVSLIHSEKALAAHIVIAKLMAMLKEKNELLERFKNVALPQYSADPEDQTDVALGNYLSNNLVQVPFIREEPGVYRFGTKRVFIRLEQGNIIIRVGGGYMHLDEFIDIYTPQELGKLSPKPEDAMKMALAQKLMEQLDDKFTTCIGLNKKDLLPPSDAIPSSRPEY